MTRLFLSLYLFIAVSIIGLTAGLERLFFVPTDQLDSGQLNWIKTFENLQHDSEALLAFLQRAQIEHRQLDVSSLAAADSLQSHLANGDIVQGFSEQNWQIYVPIDSTTIIQIQFPNATPSTSNWWLYSGIFFALLGGVIAIWLYPLWRDLTRLSTAASEMRNDGGLNLPKMSNRSPLVSIHDALRGLSERVGVLLRNQRELTGAVTHEFRTPLARLKFALADKTHLTESQLDAILSDVSELERLVQEMLDFTRLDVHKPELHIEAIPLYELCQQRLMNTPPTDTVRLSISGDQPIFNGDGHLIARAIDNLLSNAIRHADSQVDLSIHVSEQAIKIAIEDDGPGIPKTLHKKIFDPFYRPDDARDRNTGGAGLGLAIVNRIQQWHGAQCWVESSSLGGAKFVLCYPTNA